MAQVRLNLLLMGKTGNGKSCTGNSLLGRRTFVVSSQTKSVTKEVQQDFANFENFTLKIVDGPGLNDTDKDIGEDQEMAAANMAQALAMCDGGVDAFLFVYQYGTKFTNDEKGTLEGLKHIFGEKYYSHMIVVLSMGDLFRDNMEEEGKDNITFLDWCREQTGAFKQLFDDCGGRFVLFNNREKDKNNMHKQIKEIIELANQLQGINGRYTCQTFQAVKELRDRYIVEKKVPILSEQIQEKCGLLTAELEKYIKTPSEQGKLTIQESIAVVKNEIKEHDKGTNLLHELLERVEKVEENLDAIDQLNERTKELNDTRKSSSFWTAFREVPSLFLILGNVIFAGRTMIPLYFKLLSHQEKKLKEQQDKTKDKLTKAVIDGNSTK